VHRHPSGNPGPSEADLIGLKACRLKIGERGASPSSTQIAQHLRYLCWQRVGLSGLRKSDCLSIALLSARDRWHARALAINQRPTGPLVTTEWVLTEVGDAFSQPGARQKFVQFLNLLMNQPDVQIVASSSDLFRRGAELFAARPDKEWSLTDCISFVVMADLGITDSLTSDRHFEQASFRILLKD
jgi:predicted nucleic acid-binding protein